MKIGTDILSNVLRSLQACTEEIEIVADASFITITGKDVYVTFAPKSPASKKKAIKAPSR